MVGIRGVLNQPHHKEEWSNIMAIFGICSLGMEAWAADTNQIGASQGRI